MTELMRVMALCNDIGIHFTLEKFEEENWKDKYSKRDLSFPLQSLWFAGGVRYLFDTEDNYLGYFVNEVFVPKKTWNIFY